MTIMEEGWDEVARFFDGGCWTVSSIFVRSDLLERLIGKPTQEIDAEGEAHDGETHP